MTGLRSLWRESWTATRTPRVRATSRCWRSRRPIRLVIGRHAELGVEPVPRLVGWARGSDRRRARLDRRRFRVLVCTGTGSDKITSSGIRQQERHELEQVVWVSASTWPWTSRSWRTCCLTGPASPGSRGDEHLSVRGRGRLRVGQRRCHPARQAGALRWLCWARSSTSRRLAAHWWLALG